MMTCRLYTFQIDESLPTLQHARARSTSASFAQSVTTAGLRLPEINGPNASGAASSESPSPTWKPRARTSSTRRRRWTSPLQTEQDIDVEASNAWELRGRQCGELQTIITARLVMQHLAAWRGEAMTWMRHHLPTKLQHRPHILIPNHLRVLGVQVASSLTPSSRLF